MFKRWISVSIQVNLFHVGSKFQYVVLGRTVNIKTLHFTEVNDSFVDLLNLQQNCFFFKCNGYNIQGYINLRGQK